MIKLNLIPTNNHLDKNGYNRSQEEEIYDNQLYDIYMNARWYLDNLDYIYVYRVSWWDYRSKSAVTPYKLVNKRKAYKEPLP